MKLVKFGAGGTNRVIEECKALDVPKLRIVTLSAIISLNSTCLPKPFHGDPADQIIVATAREESATVITKGKKMLNYKYVRSVW